jgi:hypothetical protein
MGGQQEATTEYRSYLLRLWHMHNGGEPVWRASLENPLTEEIMRFDDLPSLFMFLHTQTGQSTSAGSGDGHPPPLQT